MTMLGNDAALLQKHASQHYFLTNHELPLQQRVQFFERNGMPGNVLMLGLAGRMFGYGSLGTGVRRRRFFSFTGGSLTLKLSCHRVIPLFLNVLAQRTLP